VNYSTDPILVRNYSYFCSILIKKLHSAILLNTRIGFKFDCLEDLDFIFKTNLWFSDENPDVKMHDIILNL
jgi:hypothetical protein